MGHIVQLSDVDTSKGVTLTFSNTHIDEQNTMEVGCEWPRDKIIIMQLIKLAVRLDLDFKYQAFNKEAEDYISAYYEEYNS